MEGQCDPLPEQRGYEIRLEGSQQPQKVMINGEEVSQWTYNPATLQTTIHVPRRDKRQPVTVTAIAQDGISALGEKSFISLNDVFTRQTPNTKNTITARHPSATRPL